MGPRHSFFGLEKAYSHGVFRSRLTEQQRVQTQFLVTYFDLRYGNMVTISRYCVGCALCVDVHNGSVSHCRRPMMPETYQSILDEIKISMGRARGLNLSMPQTGETAALPLHSSFLANVWCEAKSFCCEPELGNGAKSVVRYAGYVAGE